MSMIVGMVNAGGLDLGLGEGDGEDEEDEDEADETGASSAFLATKD